MDAMTPEVSSAENMVKRTIARRLMLFCFVMLNALSFNICEARNPEMVTGLSVEVLNYAQEPIHFLKLNGEKVSLYVEASKIGGVKSSGVDCCSGGISARKPTAEVTIETKHDTYTTQAEVELPFPDIMDKLMIHVLPGRKVVIEVVSGYSFPRQDLIDTQIKALRLKREYSFTGPVRTKPHYTDFYKPD